MVFWFYVALSFPEEGSESNCLQDKVIQLCKCDRYHLTILCINRTIVQYFDVWSSKHRLSLLLNQWDSFLWSDSCVSLQCVSIQLWSIRPQLVRIWFFKVQGYLLSIRCNLYQGLYIPECRMDLVSGFRFPNTICCLGLGGSVFSSWNRSFA